MTNKADLNRVFVFQRLSIPHLIDIYAFLRLVETPLSMTAIDIKEGLATEFRDAWIPPTSFVVQVLEEAELEDRIERMRQSSEHDQVQEEPALTAYKITAKGKQAFRDRLLDSIAGCEAVVECLRITTRYLFRQAPTNHQSIPPTRSQSINTPFFQDFVILATVEKTHFASVDAVIFELEETFKRTYEFDHKALSTRVSVLAAKRLVDLTQGISITSAGLQHLQQLRSAEAGFFSRMNAIEYAFASILRQLKSHLKKKQKGHLRLVT